MVHYNIYCHQLFDGVIIAVEVIVVTTKTSLNSKDQQDNKK